MTQTSQQEPLAKHTYMLSLGWAKRFTMFNVACARCGQSFRAGDEMVSRPKSRIKAKEKGTLSRYYHRKCWESLFFDCAGISESGLG